MSNREHHKAHVTSSARLLSTLQVPDAAAPGPMVQPWWKSSFDRVVSAAALFLLAPVFGVIALAIKLESSGPVFFLQWRTGHNGQPFKVRKFRTMTVMEDGPALRQATEKDPRVTRIGRLLRRTSLDELPQLINVLDGEMSLVGPRPHALAHDRFYGQAVPNYDRRQCVKPGITGWAQVNGLRGEIKDIEQMRQRLSYDLQYIENASFVLDLKIIARTFAAVCSQRNAY